MWVSHKRLLIKRDQKAGVFNDRSLNQISRFCVYVLNRNDRMAGDTAGVGLPLCTERIVKRQTFSIPYVVTQKKTTKQRKRKTLSTCRMTIQHGYIAVFLCKCPNPHSFLVVLDLVGFLLGKTLSHACDSFL